MRARTTGTLDPECIIFLDRLAHQQKMSRSSALEVLAHEDALSSPPGH